MRICAVRAGQHFCAQQEQTRTKDAGTGCRHRMHEHDGGHEEQAQKGMHMTKSQQKQDT